MMQSLVTECEVPGLAAPTGPYAHATILGCQLHISGLIAWNEHGALIGRNDAAAQATFIFERMALILAAVGSDLADVAKLTFYLIDLADRLAIAPVRRRVFGDRRPASTLVQVAALIGEGTLLEIDAIAGVRRP